MVHFKCLLVFASILLQLDSNGAKEQTQNPKQPRKCLTDVENIPESLAKYQSLRNLQNTDEDMFYTCLIDHVKELLPIVYTPVVGEVCEKYAKITGPKRGLTLAINEEDKVEEKLTEWKNNHGEVKAIVVTDGGRILGLGDLGANGMGIPVGKMAIYSALGGVDPKVCLPVTLDVGTNNAALRASDMYVGLKQERPAEDVYKKFVDKFMTSVTKVFKSQPLIQFEDFANKYAFEFLKKYRDHYTMFNDDIQGTAAVALAGILAAERFTGKRLVDSTVLFVGAGEAAVGIANLLVQAMEAEGITRDDAYKKIFMKIRKGLVMETDIKDEHDERRPYAKSIPKDVKQGQNTVVLEEIVKWLKPNILIGASSAGGVFTKEVLEEMGKNNDHPIILPLSNPVDRSECTAKEAYEHTNGKALFASGSPFDPVTVKGQLREPQQCNNAYIFPGVALAITTAQMTRVPDKVFLIAAETLAKTCTQQTDYDKGSLFPRLENLRDCSVEIATQIAKYAFTNKDLGLTKLENPPQQEAEIRNFISIRQYTPTGLQ